MQEHLLKWVRVGHDHRAYSTEAEAHAHDNLIEIPVRFKAVHGLLKINYQEKYCICGSIAKKEIASSGRRQEMAEEKCRCAGVYAKGFAVGYLAGNAAGRAKRFSNAD